MNGTYPSCNEGRAHNLNYQRDVLFMAPVANQQDGIRIISLIRSITNLLSGCFRTEEGARDYPKIMSYVGTAHKQGYNAYKEIKNAISGQPDFIFE